MTLLPKTKSLPRKIDKLYAIGLVVCSALTTSFLPFESSYAYSVFNKSGYIAQAKQTNLTRYTVQPGDFLSLIAEKFYGDGSEASWRKIYEANHDVIGPDHTQLQAGMVLVIPGANQPKPTPGSSKGSYNDFLNALAKRETGPGNPTYNNTNNLWGFIGKYQFGEALLIDLGYYQANSYYGQPGVDKNYWRGTWTGKHGVNSKEDFLNNKNNVQEIAIQEAMQYKWVLLKNQLNGRSIEEFIGQERGGVLVTKSGILAAAHLRGEKGVSRLLLNNEVSQDESGTSILAYLSEFAGYQTPFN
ncbi:MAG: LysM peptidoglycan-binding domain-containing protein [Cyanobacteriota bacterium]